MINKGPSVGRVALWLDEMMAEHPQEFDAIARAFNAELGVAVNDQGHAAQRDARRLLELMGREMRDVLRTDVRHGDVEEWVRLPMVETYVAWVAGEAEVCQHLADARGPQPAVAAAWMPGKVVCPRPACVLRLSLPHGSEGDRTCDRCGRVVAGLAHDDGIFPSRIVYGPLVYMWGACRDCAPPEQVAAPTHNPSTAGPNRAARRAAQRRKGRAA